MSIAQWSLWRLPAEERRRLDLVHLTIELFVHVCTYHLRPTTPSPLHHRHDHHHFSPIGKQADALYPDCCTHFLSFQPEKYSLQKWRSSVYEVAVDGPLPAAAANLTAAGTVPYVIQIERTAASGTVLRNNVFEDSRGFFGRWKSSHSVIENCTFRGSAQNVLELQMLPSHYEASVKPIRNSEIGLTPHRHPVGNRVHVLAHK